RGEAVEVRRRAEEVEPADHRVHGQDIARWKAPVGGAGRRPVGLYGQEKRIFSDSVPRAKRGRRRPWVDRVGAPPGHTAPACIVAARAAAALDPAQGAGGCALRNLSLTPARSGSPPPRPAAPAPPKPPASPPSAAANRWDPGPVRRRPRCRRRTPAPARTAAGPAAPPGCPNASGPRSARPPPHPAGSAWACPAAGSTAA